MEAQFTVAVLCRLSFSLPKSLSFPDRVEFVGIDIGVEYNMPAASKFELLRTWPKAVDVRAIDSFVALGMWYQKWITYFEVKVQPLREITNSYEWDNNITPELWTKDTDDAWNFVIDAIVSDPCLALWDSRYRFYLLSDFCSKGTGFVGMQPAHDPVSMAAMRHEMEGGNTSS